MTTPAPAAPQKLALATAVAAVVAALVLVVAILPAEYGIDPTGLGGAAGFTKLNEENPPGAVVEEPADTEPAPLYEMRATWRLVSLPLAEQKGRVTRSDTEERVVIPLSITNLTSVTAALAWDDTDRINGQPTDGDTFEISIRGPGGLRSQLVQVKNEPGQLGNASVTLNLRSVPFPQENATSGIVFATAEDTSGVGNWTFVVRLYSAGSLNGSEERDPGNNWTLSVSGEAYELEVHKQAERAGDRVRITINPDRGVEYKFAMQPGAIMTYRWESTGPVYSDMHADHFGDPENVTTAKIDTLTKDEGIYTAPYYGRHGWYWRNDGATPITITLETTGEYTILGVPT